jgi:cytochrome P450
MAPANAKPGLLLSLKSSLERYASTAAPTRDSKQHLVVYLIVFAVLGFIIINRGNLYLRRRRMKKEHGCKPCPHVFNKDPIFGLDVLRSNLRNAKNRAALEGNRQRYINFKSNTFHSRIITGPVITTIEPENVKTILSLRFKDYSIGSRQTAFSPLLGNGIFNADGVRWANSRHLLRPNFARDQVADLDSLERHFKLMLKFIPKDGTTVDLQELFFRLTMDTATEFLFNHSTNSLRMMGQDDGTNEDVIFAKAFNFAQEDVVTRTRFGFFYRFLNDKKQGERAINICHAYIDKWVDDAVQFHNQREKTAESSAKKADSSKANGEERYVFIHELAKQTSDKKRIRDELINILLAGRDTTASLLSNMFFEIAKRPEIWKKLQEEVATLDGRMPTYEELRNLKYVKWCLNECKYHLMFSCRTIPVSDLDAFYIYTSLTSTQLSACTPSSPQTRATPSATPSSPSAAAPTARILSSSPPAQS